MSCSCTSYDYSFPSYNDGYHSHGGRYVGGYSSYYDRYDS